MGVDHVFHAIGNDLAAWQRVEHPVMPHGDAVIHRYGVEFLRHAACLLDLARDQLAEVFQVHVPGHELGERVDDGDDRLAEIIVLHPRSAPQSARAGHVAAVGRGAGAVGGHWLCPGCGGWRVRLAGIMHPAWGAKQEMLWRDGDGLLAGGFSQRWSERAWRTPNPTGRECSALLCQRAFEPANALLPTFRNFGRTGNLKSHARALQLSLQIVRAKALQLIIPVRNARTLAHAEHCNWKAEGPQFDGARAV